MKETVAADLPPKTELIRPVELAGDQRELYESIRAARTARCAPRSRRRASGVRDRNLGRADEAAPSVLRSAARVRVVGARGDELRQFALFFELVMNQLEQGRRVLVFPRNLPGCWRFSPRA